MDGGDEATRALAREVGRQSVDRLGDGLTRIIGETSALFRWLLTMLVLLNAAGLWFLITFPAILTVDRRSVAAIFFLGLFAAILAAVLSLIVTLPVARAMRRAITYWTEVSVSGELTDDAMLSAKRVKIMSMIWLVFTSLAAAASLGLFVLGVTMAGGGVAEIARGLEIIPSDGPVPAAPNSVDLGNEAAATQNEAAPNNVAEPLPAPKPTPSSTPTPTPTSKPGPKPSAAPAPAARPTAPRQPQPPVVQRPTASPSPSAAPLPSPAPIAPTPAPAPPPTTTP